MKKNSPKTFSELEKQFVRLTEHESFIIDSLIEEANEKLREAYDLSDKIGLPFGFEIDISNDHSKKFTYTPASFASKFHGLDSKFVAQMTGVHVSHEVDPYENYGWTSSSSCIDPDDY